MDPFTADYLANLTADLTAHTLQATGRRVRESIAGAENEWALRRCIEAGVAALVIVASDANPEEQDLLTSIFSHFFGDPDVGRELAVLLRGQPLDRQELRYLFEQAGYDSATLPKLDLNYAIQVFEAAFLAVAVEEPTLRDSIQSRQLSTQTNLQRDLLATMRDLARFLREARADSVGIKAGHITAENVVSGQQIFFHLHMPHTKPQTKPQSVPAPPNDFQGRSDEINALEQLLRQAGGTTAAICGLRGLGGIGKSVLAFKVAQQVQANFPDGQIFLALRGAGANPMLPEEALREVLRALGEEPNSNLTLAQLASDYRSILRDRRVLILADDAKDVVQVKPLMPPEGNALLITSRRLFRLDGMAEPLEVGPLPENEAIQFVEGICNRIGAAAKQLVKLCGSLPLALRISATALANSSRPVEGYLQELEDERKRLRRLRGDDPEADVEATFNLSFAALSADAQTLLQQLSLFVTDFQHFTIKSVVTLRNVADNESLLSDLLDQLLSVSLLNCPDGPRDGFNLHDLVRIFAHQRLRESGEEEAVRLRHAAYYAALADVGFRKLQVGDLLGHMVFQQERASIDAAWTWLCSQPPADRIDDLLTHYALLVSFDRLSDTRTERIPRYEVGLAVARRKQERKNEALFLDRLSWAYFALGDVRRAIDFAEQCLVIDRELSNRSHEAVILRNIGHAYHNLGDLGHAMDCIGQAIVISREVGDREAEVSALRIIGDAERRIDLLEPFLAINRELGDRSREAATLAVMAQAYRDLGEVGRAVDYWEQELVIRRALGDRTGEAALLRILGGTYHDLGEVGRAVDYWEQELVIRRALGDRTGEAATLRILGGAYGGLGEVGRAVDYWEQDLEIRRALGDRTGEADTLYSLALAYYDLGEARHTLVYAKQAIVISREIRDRGAEAFALLADRIDTIDIGDAKSGVDLPEPSLVTSGIAATDLLRRSLAISGIATIDLGDVKRGIDLLEQSLVIDRELGDRSREADTLHILGGAYRDLGEVGRAVDYWEQDLEIRRALGDRTGEADTLHILGRAYHDLGEVGRAVDYWEQDLEIRRALGDRTGEAPTLRFLGRAYHDLGEVGRAVDYWEQDLEIRRALGHRTGEAATLRILGRAYHDLGEVGRAVDYWEQELVIRRALGDRSREADTLHILGRAYRDLGEVRRAVDYWEQDLEIRRALGDRTGEADTLAVTAQAYRDLGEVGRAADYWEQELVIRREIGDRNRESAILSNLARSYAARGDVHRTIKCCEQVLEITRETGGRHGEAIALGRLGTAYYDLGDEHTAIKYLEQCLSMLREIGDRRGEAIALDNLGNAYYALGNLPTAISYYEQQLVIAREIGDRETEVRQSRWLGQLLVRQEPRALGRALKRVRARIGAKPKWWQRLGR